MFQELVGNFFFKNTLMSTMLTLLAIRFIAIIIIIVVDLNATIRSVSQESANKVQDTVYQTHNTGCQIGIKLFIAASITEFNDKNKRTDQ